MTFNYDVIVVGAGHAGCEAAAAAANMGSKTLLITMDMNKIAQMSCNPAVGGIAKGQIVREIDALGGYMGIVTDRTAIQFRMLNQSKGPAMWSPRSQSDRARFIECWRGILENLPNLYIWQDTVRELLLDENTVCGVKTDMGVEFHAKSVVLTNGTFLNGLMHIGRTHRKQIIASPYLLYTVPLYGIRTATFNYFIKIILHKVQVSLIWKKTICFLINMLWIFYFNRTKQNYRKSTKYLRF